MSDELRSRDLDWLAKQVEDHFKRAGYTLTRDQSLWAGAPLVAMRAKKGAEDILIELRQRPDIPQYLQNFVLEAISREEPSALYVAVAQLDDEEGVAEEPTIAISSLGRFRQLGVGLLAISVDGKVEIERAIAFSARIATPAASRDDRHLAEIAGKFNRGDPLDALRDLVVLIEGQLRGVAERAVGFGVVNCTKAELDQMDLDGVINLLGTDKYKQQDQVRVLDTNFRADLHSFRTARNLAQHAPRNRQQRQLRDKQLKERITMGFRLSVQLGSIRVPRLRPGTHAGAGSMP